MPAIDTRHAEMGKLFALLAAQITGDIDLHIAQAKATMEQSDIEIVEKQVAEWRKNLKKESE